MLVFNKVIYPSILALVVIAFPQGQPQRQRRNVVQDQMFYKFPEKSVQCVAGDYIVTKSAAGWTVYVVQDLYFLSRLLPMRDTSGLTVVEQISVADSATPPKWRQIQLLISEYKRRFQTREDAIHAIEANGLGDSIQGLCRGVEEFPKDTSFVYVKP